MQGEGTAWTPGEYAESLFEVEASVEAAILREQERKKKENADLTSKLQME